MTQDRAIETRGLTRRFGEKLAVDGVDLCVEAGEIVGLVGPNGAGKTTFLKMLVGLTRPSAGAARVLGLDAVKDSVRVRQLTGYLPGDLGLYRNLSGRAMLEFAIGFHENADRPRARELARRMDLPLERKIKTWSSGMRQKLGIVQALSVNARVLLLDEPTQALDPSSRAAFQDLLLQERARGAALLVSSHILGEMERIADRVVFLDRGAVVAPERIEAAREAFRRRLRVVFRDPVEDRLSGIPGVRVLERRGNEALLYVDGRLSDALSRLARMDLEAIDYNRPSLGDVYRMLYLDDEPREATR